MDYHWEQGEWSACDWSRGKGRPVVGAGLESACGWSRGKGRPVVGAGLESACGWSRVRVGLWLG